MEAKWSEMEARWRRDGARWRREAHRKGTRGERDVALGSGIGVEQHTGLLQARPRPQNGTQEGAGGQGEASEPGAHLRADFGLSNLSGAARQLLGEAQVAEEDLA